VEESELLPELDALAPAVREGVGLRETELLADEVVLPVLQAVPVCVPEELPVPVLLGVCDGEMLPLNEMEPVLEAEAPTVTEGVADKDAVELLLSVEDGVLAPVPVPDCVALPVAVTLGVWEGDTVEESEVLPELDALAPAVREGVGLKESELLADKVLLPVLLAVPVGDTVELPVPLLLGVWVGELLPLSEMEPELEAEAPTVTEGVADKDAVELPLKVEEGVLAPVPVPVCVALAVGVPLGLRLPLSLPVSEIVPEEEAVDPAL